MVARLPVKKKVVGSNPTRGAGLINKVVGVASLSKENNFVLRILQHEVVPSSAYPGSTTHEIKTSFGILQI